jgi:hypothetical protein
VPVLSGGLELIDQTVQLISEGDVALVQPAEYRFTDHAASAKRLSFG